MKINLIKIHGVLAPSLPDDELALESIKRGEIVTVNVTRSRNSQFNRKFFALLNIVVENTEYLNTDQILHLLKLKLGHYDEVISTNGKVVYIPRSISFAKMSPDEFSKFYNQSINIILRDFLTNWKDSDIDSAINQIVRF